jgi:sugar (pentulose or hexulose) kinase
MTGPATGDGHVAVIDIGKTNVKLVLVDPATLAEVAVVTRPNRVLPAAPWPHFDLDGHWAFVLHHLGALHRARGIGAIAVAAHGAAGVLIDRDGALAAPMLDYEHAGPDTLAAAYDALRPPFAETGSPRLPGGLNLGAQLHWQMAVMPELRGRVAQLLTYPQYWGFRLSGERATDVTSLGCHTDLWNPWRGEPSALVARLGLAGRIAPPRRPAETLGTLRPEIARATGLPPATTVAVGIHDSNASLLPHLLGRPAPFAVLSSGTWVVAMAVGGDPVPLDPARDTLVNVSALGRPVPTARFMGGREFDRLCAGAAAEPEAADRRAVLRRGVLRLPAVEPGSGPFRGCAGGWTVEPATPGERRVAAGHYLALMADTCLALIGARGPVIIEGPLARNADVCAMLAALRPDGVAVAAAATGTAAGAALLCAGAAARPQTRAIAAPEAAEALGALARRWRAEAAALRRRSAAQSLKPIIEAEETRCAPHADPIRHHQRRESPPNRSGEGDRRG